MSEVIINRIIKLNTGIAHFWSNAHGWAPEEAAVLLSKSRLDWQVSLSHRLKDVLRDHSAEEDQAKLIESWARLGTLIENSMKLALSVYLKDFYKNESHRFQEGKIKDPDELKFEILKQIYLQHFSRKDDSEWLNEIQRLRNSIHAFKSREIYDWKRFSIELNNYLSFLKHINDRLPYPDDVYIPQDF